MEVLASRIAYQNAFEDILCSIAIESNRIAIFRNLWEAMWLLKCGTSACLFTIGRIELSVFELRLLAFSTCFGNIPCRCVFFLFICDTRMLHRDIQLVSRYDSFDTRFKLFSLSLRQGAKSDAWSHAQVRTQFTSRTGS